MNLILNDKALLVGENAKLLDTIQAHFALRSLEGIAVSVNYEVIPKSLWAGYVLKENDTILVIQATQGG